MTRNFSSVLLFLYTFLIVYLCLIPTNDIPSVNLWDKAAHLIAYFIFAFLSKLAGRNNKEFILLIVFYFFFGAAIEILQGMTGYRSMSGLDQVANSIGLFLGVIAVFLTEKILILLKIR